MLNSFGDSVYISPLLLSIQNAANLSSILIAYVTVSIIVMPIVRRVLS